MGAALIFVAYEGFELIPNAINEMENPQHNLKPAIIWSIVITIAIYVLVSIVAVGNLLPKEIIMYKEYALAVAAKPFLGQAGFLLIGLAARCFPPPRQSMPRCLAPLVWAWLWRPIKLYPRLSVSGENRTISPGPA